MQQALSAPRHRAECTSHTTFWILLPASFGVGYLLSSALLSFPRRPVTNNLTRIYASLLVALTMALLTSLAAWTVDRSGYWQHIVLTLAALVVLVSVLHRYQIGVDKTQALLFVRDTNAEVQSVLEKSGRRMQPSERQWLDQMLERRRRENAEIDDLLVR